MEEIRLRYTGGKSISKLYYNRVRYVFNKENNFITEVPLGAWYFVKQTNEFIPAPIEEKPNIDFSGTSDVVETTAEKPKEKSDKVICDICGFKARSPYGLIVHSRKHLRKKEGK